MSSVCDPSYLVQLEELQAEYFKAEKAILCGGQEYTIGDRTLKRADLRWVQQQRKQIAAEICKLKAGRGARFQRVVPGYDS